MGWSVAYNFNLDDEKFTISEAMELRRKYGRKDPRVGELWCHKNCYHSKKGSQLLTYKESIDAISGEIKKKAYFARWPESNTRKHLFCEHESLANSKRESMDYANFYKDMEEYLKSLEKNHEPFFIESVICVTRDLHDFEIFHSKEISEGISKSKVYIIDEDKRRAKIRPRTMIVQNEFMIVMKISEYTLEQLADFERGGIEKFRIEWDYLKKSKIQLIEDEKREHQMNPILQNRLKQQEKEVSQRIGYAMRLAGEWRVSGFESQDKRNRYHGEQVQVYLNKYHPEKHLPYEEITGLIEHGKQFEQCKKERGERRVIYRQDSEDSSIVFMECRYCSLRLDSFRLNYHIINKEDIQNVPKTFAEVDYRDDSISSSDPDLVPHRRHEDLQNWTRGFSFYKPAIKKFKLKKWDFTPIEKALLKSIGTPQPKSGKSSGCEVYKEHPN
jgi:hypothetical protein